MQKEFEEYKRKSEENYQEQLEKQREELKMILQSQLQRSVGEPRGTYVKWDPEISAHYFVPLPEFKKMLCVLENLNVCIQTQKAEAMALIKKMVKSHKIIVTINRRFPLNGDYISKYLVTSLCRLIQPIISSCDNAIYNNHKSVIFNEYEKIGIIESWTAAYNHAAMNILEPVSTSPQSSLKTYLWHLCDLKHIEKNCYYNNYVFNVTTFEKQCGLTWNEVDQ